MPVDPRLQFLIENKPVVSYEPLPAAELRARADEGLCARLAEHASAGPAVAATKDHRVPVQGGDITVRVYTPHGKGPFPAHLYLHGGGFWMGTLDHFDAACRDMAEGAGCVVASVAYRLAPEHPFPIPLEDCYAALSWLVAHARDLDVDADRVSVGGASAGGNLAAAVALLTKERGGPPLVLQVLEIPVLDLAGTTPSMEELAGVTGTSKEAMEQYRRFYVGDGDRTAPLVSPLLAPDLSGLPPALILTAEFDPLRDEGEAYGQHLRRAGVDATVVRRRGQIHGAHILDKLLPDEVAEYRAVLNGGLREAYEAARNRRH